jgi:hypothetical protein
VETVVLERRGAGRPPGPPRVGAVKIGLNRREAEMLVLLRLKLRTPKGDIPERSAVMRRALAVLAERMLDPDQFANLPLVEGVDGGEA